MAKANGKLSAKELAEKMGVSVASIYNWKKAGKINADADGRYSLVEVKRAITEAKNPEPETVEQKTESNEPVSETEDEFVPIPNCDRGRVQPADCECCETILDAEIIAEDLIGSVRFAFFSGAGSGAVFVGCLWIIFAMVGHG